MRGDEIEADLIVEHGHEQVAPEVFGGPQRRADRRIVDRDRTSTFCSIVCAQNGIQPKLTSAATIFSWDDARTLRRAPCR